MYGDSSRNQCRNKSPHECLVPPKWPQQDESWSAGKPAGSWRIRDLEPGELDDIPGAWDGVENLQKFGSVQVFAIKIEDGLGIRALVARVTRRRPIELAVFLPFTGERRIASFDMRGASKFCLAISQDAHQDWATFKEITA